MSASRRVCATSRTCYSNGASTCATRRCGCGGIGSARSSRRKSGGGGSAGCAGSGTGAGILMRCSCGSTASAITFGARSITRARSWRATSPKPRDKAAALAFLKKALKRHGRAEKIVTDGLRSYPAAMRQLGNFDRREMGGWLNNRAENSHLPFRRRERAMLRFRQMKALQKFTSVHASLHNHFGSERHLLDRQTYKQRRSAALAEWRALAA